MIRDMVASVAVFGLIVAGMMTGSPPVPHRWETAPVGIPTVPALDAVPIPVLVRYTTTVPA